FPHSGATPDSGDSDFDLTARVQSVLMRLNRFVLAERGMGKFLEARKRQRSKTFAAASGDWSGEPCRTRRHLMIRVSLEKQQRCQHAQHVCQRRPKILRRLPAVRIPASKCSDRLGPPGELNSVPSEEGSRVDDCPTTPSDHPWGRSRYSTNHQKTARVRQSR